ncbi:MAG: alpha-amylase family protein [Eubacterium sp.]|nr:alpha-amylase family protein [Eubacterium sp.]
MTLNKAQKQILDERFEKYDDELRWLYMELYDNSDMYGELCNTMAEYYEARSDALKEIDMKRLEEPDWYQKKSLFGMMMYVDNFAENLKGAVEKLPYVEKLGVNYLHLMPILDSPEKNSDGGYAVRDYRKVREDLGTVEDLKAFTKKCHNKDIKVCCNFVMNHTSDEHEWAVKAKQGEGEYMSRYYCFENYQEPFRYDQTVPQIYPATAPGNSTEIPEMGHYVMTTFHRYQWDLNYRNPRVFNEMVYNFLFLANCGVDVIRLDAVPYIWKELGTTCRNLPKVHTILRMFRIISEIVCPGILLLGEVVMEADRVVPYFGTKEKPECHMLYNVAAMATIWHTVATRDVGLLRNQIDIMGSLPKRDVFLNYLRCHDDIGWGLDYDMLLRYGIAEITHKEYLNEYFLGNAGFSNSRGELNRSEEIQNANFCGTTASLCGVEKAVDEGNKKALERAISLDLMLHAYMFMQAGIPIIYSGDEIGQLNDYSYKENPEKAEDSRYLHRGKFHWEDAEKITEEDSAPGKIFGNLKKLGELRKKHPAFSNEADLWTVETWEDSILGIGRYYKGEKIIGIFNFSEHEKTAWIEEEEGMFEDLMTGEQKVAKDIKLDGYGFQWLCRKL